MSQNKSSSAGKWSVAIAVVPVAVVAVFLILVMLPLWTGQATGEAGWGVMLGLGMVCYYGIHSLAVTSVIGICVGIFAVWKTKWRQGTPGLLLNLAIMLSAGSLLAIGYHERAADPERLRGAVRRGDFQMVETLLEKGFDVNYIYDDETVLCRAAEMGQNKVVEFLLLNRADVSLGDSLQRAVKKYELSKELT